MLNTKVGVSNSAHSECMHARMSVACIYVRARAYVCVYLYMCVYVSAVFFVILASYSLAMGLSTTKYLIIHKFKIF